MADSNAGPSDGIENGGSAGEDFSALVGEASDSLMSVRGENPDDIIEAALAEDEPSEEEAPESEAEADSEDESAKADEEEESEEEEEEEEEGQPEEKPAGANKRIQQLVSKRKELESKLEQQTAQFNAYAQQVQTQFQQLQQQKESQQSEITQKLMESNQLLAKQIEMLTGRRKEEEEANLSEVDHYKLQVERAAEQRAMAAVDSLRAEMKEAERKRSEEISHINTQAQIRQLSQNVTSARNAIIFEGLDPKEIDPEQGKVFDDAIMALVAARNVTPQQAAAYLRKSQEMLSQVRQKSAVKTVSKKKKAGGTKLPVGASRQAVKNTGGYPAWDLVRKAGYSSYLDWKADGAPPLG